MEFKIQKPDTEMIDQSPKVNEIDKKGIKAMFLATNAYICLGIFQVTSIIILTE